MINNSLVAVSTRHLSRFYYLNKGRNKFVEVFAMGAKCSTASNTKTTNGPGTIKRHWLNWNKQFNLFRSILPLARLCGSERLIRGPKAKWQFQECQKSRDVAPFSVRRSRIRDATEKTGECGKAKWRIRSGRKRFII